MRTEQEIAADIRNALRKRDSVLLLELADEIAMLGTDNALGIAHNARGLAAGQASQYDQAIAEYRQAQACAQRADNHVLLTSVHNNLGLVFSNVGQFDEAHVEFSASLDLAIKTGHEINMAMAYGNLGLVWANRGEYGRGVQEMLRGLEVEERLGDEGEVAASLGNIGVVYYRMGDLASALQYHLRALEISERLDDKWGIAINTGNIAATYVGIGDHATAIDFFKRAITQHEVVGNVSSVARTHANLAVALKATKQLEQARVHLQTALQMHFELGNLNELIFTAANLVQTSLQLGDIGQAREVVQSMEERPATDPRSRILFQSASGLLAQAEGDLERALELQLGALRMAEEIGATDLVFDMHKDLRDLSKSRRDLDGYISHNEQFLELKEQHSGHEVATRLATMKAERAIASERAEREKERAVLHSALPKHIVERVLRGDDVSGDLIEDAAIIFLDIVGFTVKSANMQPKDLTKLLSQIFTTFDGICAEHDVTKIKTIGDSYMAVAFPQESPSSEQRVASCRHRAAQAALAMMASSFTWPSGEHVQFRVGIHAGPVVAGVLGSDRLQYDVWGDTVNTASRLEGTSEPGRIQVSEAFAVALNTSPPGPLSSLRGGTETTSHVIPSEARNDEHGTWHLAPRGEIELKGKGLMKTYWLQVS